MLLTWWPAVLMLMNRRSAISPLENPFATRRRTSISLRQQLEVLRARPASHTELSQESRRRIRVGIAPNRSNAASCSRLGDRNRAIRVSQRSSQSQARSTRSQGHAGLTEGDGRRAGLLTPRAPHSPPAPSSREERLACMPLALRERRNFFNGLNSIDCCIEVSQCDVGIDEHGLQREHAHHQIVMIG